MLMNFSDSQWLRFTTYQLVARIFDVNIANAGVKQRNWLEFDFDVKVPVENVCDKKRENSAKANTKKKRRVMSLLRVCCRDNLLGEKQIIKQQRIWVVQSVHGFKT